MAKLAGARQQLNIGLQQLNAMLGPAVEDVSMADLQEETQEDLSDYRRRDVVAGATENGFAEILSGLAAGEQVAVEGVFKLKSELLLAGEEE